RFTGPQQLAGWHPPEAANQPAPDSEGKEGCLRHPRHNSPRRIASARRHAGGVQLGQPLAPLAKPWTAFRVLRQLPAFDRPRRKQFIRQHPRDVGSRAYVPLQVAFRQKLFEGADHGIARTAQLFSQNSAGGKTCARRKSALEHRKAHLVVDLAVERRCLRATVQSEREERGGGSPAQHERLWLLLWLP